jgi:hypothetical protein
MSRTTFIKETSKYHNWRLKNNLPVHISVFNVDKYIRDKWITENRHDELIAYIRSEWDNGDFNDYTDFIEEYEQYLLREKLSIQFIKLWNGIVKIRLTNFQWYHKQSKIKQTQSYTNLTFEKKEYVIKAIERYTNGLLELKEFEEIEKIQALKIKINKLEIPKK